MLASLPRTACLRGPSQPDNPPPHHCYLRTDDMRGGVAHGDIYLGLFFKKKKSINNVQLASAQRKLQCKYELACVPACMLAAYVTIISFRISCDTLCACMYSFLSDDSLFRPKAACTGRAKPSPALYYFSTCAAVQQACVREHPSILGCHHICTLTSHAPTRVL